MSDTVSLQLILLVTTIIGFVVTLITQMMNRRWAVQDREANVKLIISKAEAEAEALRIHTDSVANSLRINTNIIAKDLRECNSEITDKLLKVHDTSFAAITNQLAEVKTEANKAYTEANHINIKIENLNKQLLKQSE